MMVLQMGIIRTVYLSPGHIETSYRQFFVRYTICNNAAVPLHVYWGGGGETYRLITQRNNTSPRNLVSRTMPPT